jgi:shikimate kinase
MAVGKSAVGRTLARRLKRRFVDLDTVIEKAEGMKVKHIFEQKGEQYFREREKQALADVLGRDNQVIATGGGAILNGENLRLLLDRALLVCLTASTDALLKRAGSGGKRPLLNDADRKTRIEDLLRQRDDTYAHAHYRIDTTNLTIEQVAAKILELAKPEN